MLAKLLFLGLVIGTNNLAASLALGALGKIDRKWRIIVVFGIFEFLMPLAGIWLGKKATSLVGDAATVISVLILLGLAALSFYAAAKPAKEDKKLADRITTWKGLIALEFGLSLDNLAAGFSLGLHPEQLNPLLLATTIATFSIVYTWLGLKTGNKVQRHWQNYAEVAAGLLLCLLAALTWFEVI
ncbi:MAG: manganese efflux pump MntP family protein [Hymenobacteraceae bacterium]|nr:manganese efflux pump MntP family protein [Hymenobacteraceae bacterium]MDX5396231.1 manganese efflux pump MntP family protein [Hymenobacteraceae bacterium]MDX5443535.1 manganese efflux pump MntP family protein [Hymenobacteraceae bacterium]MDX5512294.1 manganese efflux pump MntP family protein [Hymenobacteraceae bacterium]